VSELIQLKGIGRFEERERGDGDPRPSILDPQSSIVHPQSSMLDPQSSIVHPQSSILDPRSSGKQYWRSLEELAETDEFQELLHREVSQIDGRLVCPRGINRMHATAS